MLSHLFAMNILVFVQLVTLVSAAPLGLDIPKLPHGTSSGVSGEAPQGGIIQSPNDINSLPFEEFGYLQFGSIVSTIDEPALVQPSTLKPDAQGARTCNSTSYNQNKPVVTLL